MWENPFNWLSNTIASQENPVNISTLQTVVNEFFADSVIPQQEGDQVSFESEEED
jgi:hypothetical protein